MSSEQQILQIKVVTQSIPENDSDRAIFAVFDFLLTDKPQLITERSVEKLKLLNHDHANEEQNIQANR